VHSGTDQGFYLRRWLTFYVTFCGSPTNQDILLKVLQWSLWMMAHTGELLHNQNKQWISRISEQLSYARYAMRLLGFPMALEAALTNSWALDKSSTVYRVIGKILAYSMAGYYPTEMVAYLQWLAPDAAADGSSATAEPSKKWNIPDTWSHISCFFWFVYVVAELTQCILQWLDLRAKKWCLEKAKKRDNDTTTTVCSSVSELSNQLINIRLQTARNTLYLLPSFYYSFPNWVTRPWLRPYTVSALMWCEAVVSLYQAIWNQT